MSRERIDRIENPSFTNGLGGFPSASPRADVPSNDGQARPWQSGSKTARFRDW
jgi:hypothetical protein